MTANEFKEKLNKLEFNDDDEVVIAVELENGGTAITNITRIGKDTYGDLEIIAEE